MDCSPHTQGCPDHPKYHRMGRTLFPAHAGMPRLVAKSAAVLRHLAGPVAPRLCPLVTLTVSGAAGGVVFVVSSGRAPFPDQMYNR